MRSGNYGSAADKCAHVHVLQPCRAARLRRRLLPVRDATRTTRAQPRCRYTQCIALSPGGERDAKLLCNRSLALLKAGRHAQSADDADRACKLAPEWNKAWFRRGAARAALGDHAAALASYSCGLRLDPANRELRSSVRAAVRRLTREQLAAELLQQLAALQASGALLPPEKEDVSDAERSEAMFRHLYMWMRDKPAPGDYYDYVTLWSEAPWTAGAQPRAPRMRGCCAVEPLRECCVGLLCWLGASSRAQAWRTCTAPPCTSAPSATRRRAATQRQQQRSSSPAAASRLRGCRGSRTRTDSPSRTSTSPAPRSPSCAHDWTRWRGRGARPAHAP